MTNDPNDRFLIRDNSAQPDAYTGGDKSEDPSRSRTNGKAVQNIEEAFATRIPPVAKPTRIPADTMFSDLDRALDHHDSQKNSRQQRQVQYRQNQRQEEQLRQQRLKEEQHRRKLLQNELAVSQTLTESVYDFEIGQPLQSLYSGRTIHLAQMPAVRKEAAPAIVPQTETAPADMSLTEEMPAGLAQKELVADSAQKEDTFAVLPQKEEAVSDTAQKEEAFASLAKPQEAVADAPKAEEDAAAPAGSRDGEREQGRFGAVAAIIGLLAAVVVLFFVIRRISPGFSGSSQSTPSGSQSESTADSTLQGDESSADQAAGTDSSDVTDSNDMSGTDSVGTGILPDPNDIEYLASVNEQASNDAIAELSEEAPRLYLSAYAIRISAGTSINALSYVENIEDDHDDRYRLYRDISIDGLSEFDANVPGTYELIYFCYDSAANRSNKAKLTVIVE